MDKKNKIRLNIDKTKHMVINQTTAVPKNITINNDNNQVENYLYLGSLLNDKVDYKTTNCHIYLIKQLKRMGYKKEILMNIYRIIKLSQYLYNAPLLGSASTQAKKEMEKQQHNSHNIGKSILNVQNRTNCHLSRPSMCKPSRTNSKKPNISYYTKINS
jgi:hypothetical protein